jgi:hypothetical protein
VHVLLWLGLRLTLTLLGVLTYQQTINKLKHKHDPVLLFIFINPTTVRTFLVLVYLQTAQIKRLHIHVLGTSLSILNENDSSRSIAIAVTAMCATELACILVLVFVLYTWFYLAFNPAECGMLDFTFHVGTEKSIMARSSK